MQKLEFTTFARNQHLQVFIMTKRFFVSLIISLFVTNAYQGVLAKPSIEVHIVDYLPDNNVPLTFHCASKDDDLGYHHPKVGDDFHFHFLPRVIGHTLFFCHFWWGKKQASFDVYTSKLSYNCLWDETPVTLCYWKVQGNGFFLGPSLNEGKKMHDWNE